MFSILHPLPSARHCYPIDFDEKKTAFDLKTVIWTKMSPMSLQVTGWTDGEMTDISLSFCLFEVDVVPGIM